MRMPMGKPPSVYGLLAVGLILVIEPVLPWYHFSPFWFLLGVAVLWPSAAGDGATRPDSTAREVTPT